MTGDGIVTLDGDLSVCKANSIVGMPVIKEIHFLVRDLLILATI